MQDAIRVVLESPAEVLVAIDAQHPNIICTHQHAARLVQGYQSQASPIGSPLLGWDACVRSREKSYLGAAWGQAGILNYCFPASNILDNKLPDWKTGKYLLLT